MKKVFCIILIVLIIMSCGAIVLADDPIWPTPPAGAYAYRVVYWTGPSGYLISCDKQFKFHVDQTPIPYFFTKENGSNCRVYQIVGGAWSLMTDLTNKALNFPFHGISSNVLANWKHANFDVTNYDGGAVYFAANDSTYDYYGHSWSPTLDEGQYFPNVPVETGYDYRIVFRKAFDAKTYCVIASAEMYCTPSTTYDYLGIYAATNYKLYSHQGTVSSWTLEETVTNLAADNDRKYMVLHPLVNSILYANYTIHGKYGMGSYYNGDTVPNYDDGGMITDPDDTGIYPDIPSDGAFEYQVAYISQVDGSINYIKSNQKLTASWNDENSYYELRAGNICVYEVYVKDGAAWYVTEGEQYVSGQYAIADQVYDSQAILYINYTMLDQDGKVFASPLTCPYDSTGAILEDENAVDGFDPPERPDGFWENLLYAVLVPSEERYNALLTNVKDSMAEALGYSDFLDMLESINDVVENEPVFTQNIMLYGMQSLKEVNWVNLDMFDQGRTFVYSVITAVLIIGMVIYNINQVYKFLNRGAELSGPIARMDRNSQKGS